VDCGIRDVGGVEILNWMRRATDLQMICVEQNNFSEKLRLEFNQFSIANPQVFIVH
jgi:hypothetical protein